MTTANDGNDVTNHCASRRSDDTDALWECRELAFARRVEETFSKQAALELLESKLEGTSTTRLHRLGNKL